MKHLLIIEILRISFEIALGQKTQKFTDDKSTLFQVMFGGVWQVSQFLVTPCGISRRTCVEYLVLNKLFFH